MNGHGVRKVDGDGGTVTVTCECVRAFVGLTLKEAVEAYGDHRASAVGGECSSDWCPVRYAG